MCQSGSHLHLLCPSLLCLPEAVTTGMGCSRAEGLDWSRMCSSIPVYWSLASLHPCLYRRFFVAVLSSSSQQHLAAGVVITATEGKN